MSISLDDSKGFACLTNHSLEDGRAGVSAVQGVPPVGLECVNAVTQDALNLQAWT